MTIVVAPTVEENEKGERIAGDSELSIYNALGLPYQAPEERG